MPHFDLASLPFGSKLRAVTADPAVIAGRRALRISLIEEIAEHGQYDVDFVDMPTFALLPTTIRNGTISVDILARLTARAPDFARAFAGIAYRVVGDGDRFEAVYLRPLNGLKLNPPPPRDKRALQYFAYPDWRFERLRQEHRDGRYEAGANIGPGEWTNLAIDIDETHVRVAVNGVDTLTLAQTKADPVEGSVGLFVDIGTEAFFSDLRIDQRA